LVATLFQILEGKLIVAIGYYRMEERTYHATSHFIKMKEKMLLAVIA